MVDIVNIGHEITDDMQVIQVEKPFSASPETNQSAVLPYILQCWTRGIQWFRAYNVWLKLFEFLLRHCLCPDAKWIMSGSALKIRVIMVLGQAHNDLSGT